MKLKSVSRKVGELLLWKNFHNTYANEKYIWIEILNTIEDQNIKTENLREFLNELAEYDEFPVEGNTIIIKAKAL